MEEYSNSLIDPQKKKPNNSPTPLSNFIYKAISAFVLIALLPIFPSQSPELGGDKTNILTRSWELLHLLLVGVAVSYGLFSRRNSESGTAEKETRLKPDVSSGILHMSSVFLFHDDDEETIESPRKNETKVQNCNYSQHNPVEPVVMVAKKEEEEIVLPSPIPWRSRSGRMEVEEESCFPSPTPRSTSMTPSRRRLSPSPSMSSEISTTKSPAPPPQSRMVRSQSRKKRNEFREKMIIESDSSDTDDDDDDDDSKRSSEEEEEEVPNSGPEENEVDKKADEFIAKFREQIRLQRIEAIKRSTEQKSVRNQNKVL